MKKKTATTAVSSHEKPLRGMKLRYCSDFRQVGNQCLSTFRRLGGKVVEKGGANFIITEFWDGVNSLDSKPKSMSYKVYEQLLDATGESMLHFPGYKVWRQQNLSDYLDDLIRSRNQSRMDDKARRQREAQAAIDALQDHSQAIGHVGF